MYTVNRNSNTLLFFQEQIKKYLFTSLPLWQKYVAEDKLQAFIEVFMVQHFESKNRLRNLELCGSILQGLSHAMKLPNPAQNSWSVLCRATERIFELLPNEIRVRQVNI